MKTRAARCALAAALGLAAACGSHRPAAPDPADPPGALDALALAYDDTIVTTSARTVDFNGQAFVPRAIHAEKSRAGAELHVDTLVSRAVLGLREDLTRTPP